MIQDWKKLGEKGQGVQGRPEMVTKSKQIFVKLCSTSHGQPSMIAMTGQSLKCNKRWFHNNEIFSRIRWEGLPSTGMSREKVGWDNFNDPLHKQNKHVSEGITSLNSLLLTARSGTTEEWLSYNGRDRNNWHITDTPWYRCFVFDSVLCCILRSLMELKGKKIK